MKSCFSKLSFVSKLTFCSLSILLLTSCDPLKGLNKELKRLGYIPYKTPLQYAGPGTLVGGKASKLQLVASPATCFPKEIDGVPTKIFRVDHSTLPSQSKTITTNGKLNLKLMEMLSGANMSIGAGVNFKSVNSIYLKMEGIHIEYIDSIALVDFYRNQMSETCKDFLDKVGFIIQAIKVDKLTFRFFGSNGAGIRLDLDNLQNIVNIDTEADFTIVDDVNLEITTPKYIGFQLARLLKSDNGVSLHRATKTRGGKFVFKTLDLFEEVREEIAENESQALEPDVNQFSSRTGDEDLDNNSIFK